MPHTSFNNLLRSAAAAAFLSAHEDELRGKFGTAIADSSARARPSRGLDQRLGSARRFGFRAASHGTPRAFDARQRAIVKIHYFGHAGGGGAALRAHARYVARETAELEPDARAHGRYLSRDGREPFYDAQTDRVDGAGLTNAWAHRDRRHFRIILGAENGADLRDLRPYVREVMARAEAALGARLTWIAVDHWDTDNPHTHIILRGRSADGRPLVLPRDFVKHGLRNLARDAATDRLGARTPAQEREALMREARAHRPTRLDAMLQRHIGADGCLRVARLREADVSVETALRARARELSRLGMARELGRNVYQFQPAWRDRLSALELHLDHRKRLVRERTRQTRTQNLPQGRRMLHLPER